jgi:hypothetical protein
LNKNYRSECQLKNSNRIAIKWFIKIIKMQTSTVKTKSTSNDGNAISSKFNTEIVKKISASDKNLMEGAVFDLFNNSLLALEITNFLSEKACDELVKTVLRFPLDSTYLGGKANKILVSQHNKQDDQDGYFEGAATHPLLNEPALKNAINEIFSALNNSGLKVEVAKDDVRQATYCPGIIREFHSTLYLHNDFGKREGIGWNPIGRVTKQWAYVVKLTQCEGGATRWYPKRWELEDEIYFNLRGDNYSYAEDVVDGVDKHLFAGSVGTLILFDCTCYHAVQEVISGNRYTLGGFIGLIEPENKLIIWS